MKGFFPNVERGVLSNQTTISELRLLVSIEDQRGGLEFMYTSPAIAPQLLVDTRDFILNDMRYRGVYLYTVLNSKPYYKLYSYS